MAKKVTKTAEQKNKRTNAGNGEENISQSPSAKKAESKEKDKDNKAEKIEIEIESSENKTEHKKKDKKENELKKKLEETEIKSREWHDKYLRLSAEFDNYRKRTLKEKADLLKLANEDLLKDILPVIDDFERGIENIDKSQDIDALKTGVHLIYNKFNEFIKQKGIREIEAREKEFDIDFHEALTKIPAPEEELKGKVVDVIEKGYLLNDKVIRYAKVVVGE